ncbi:hypothetical protein RhiJN_20005 [Ceratobasidium sp. AG-Ba]|nr:hypothetical protein RhiJN_20005 [Ceratobasidium sp. AG-Ba]
MGNHNTRTITKEQYEDFLAYLATKATCDTEVSTDVQPGEQNIYIAYAGINCSQRADPVIAAKAQLQIVHLTLTPLCRLPEIVGALQYLLITVIGPPRSLWAVTRGDRHLSKRPSRQHNRQNNDTPFLSVEPDTPSSRHAAPSRAPTPPEYQGRERPPSPDNQPSPCEPSPGEGPWSYSRDASPERLLDPPENRNDTAHPSSPDDQAETPEEIPIDDPNPYSYPYDPTPMSHTEQKINKKGLPTHGGRNGTKTAIEKLGNWLSKFEYTRQRIHPFAIKKKISYFNPYSAIQAPPDCYDIIAKPKELVGGPGRGDVPLHVAAGLRMDKDFYNTLQCYDLAPMLLHFRDGTNEDCWLVAMIAQQYLQGNPTLTQVKDTSKTKADMFADHSKYVDDYSVNACSNRTANNDRATSSRASTTNTRHNRPHNQAVDHPCLQDANPPRGRSDLPCAPVRAHAAANPSHGQSIPNSRCIPRTNYTQDDDDEALPGSEPNPTIYDLPPTPTARQVRKADKRVAREETRREAAESRSAKATSGTKGKQRAKPPHKTTPPLETDEESEKEEEVSSHVGYVLRLTEESDQMFKNIRMFTKKVKPGPRQHARVILPEPEAHTPTSVPKSQPKSTKPSAKTQLPTKRKSAEQLDNEDEDPIPKKRGKSDTATGSKRIMEEAGDEGERAKQPAQQRAKPTPKMRPVPSEVEPGPPLPPFANPTGNSNNPLEPNASCEVPTPRSPGDPPSVEPNEERDTTASSSTRAIICIHNSAIEWSSCGEEDDKNDCPSYQIHPGQRPPALQAWLAHSTLIFPLLLIFLHQLD